VQPQRRAQEFGQLFPSDHPIGTEEGRCVVAAGGNARLHERLDEGKERVVGGHIVESGDRGRWTDLQAIEDTRGMKSRIRVRALDRDVQAIRLGEVVDRLRKWHGSEEVAAAWCFAHSRAHPCVGADGNFERPDRHEG